MSDLERIQRIIEEDAEVLRGLAESERREWPGRLGEVRGMVACNARFSSTAKVAAPHSWAVRFGSAQSPDYAHPRMGGSYTAGHLLTPDEADELAEYLRRAAAWARAQNFVDGHEGSKD